jgi:pectate lyase
MRLRLGFFVVLLAVVLTGSTVVAQKAEPSDQTAQTAGVWAKLDQTLDTTFTKAGDKVSMVLQSEVSADKLVLPKGTKLAGTVVKSVKQGKEHANAGMVLLFDTATLKDKSTVPVHVTIAALAPSASDEVEKVDVGSGQVTDASMAAAKAAHQMDDPNGHAAAGSSTKVNGITATSSIKGVLLFASPDEKSSGVIVAQAGERLELHKWTRFDVLVTAR